MGNFIREVYGLVESDKEDCFISDTYYCETYLEKQQNEKEYRETVFKMAICPTCGKEFIVPIENVFKITTKGKVWHFCKYSCKTKAEREIPMFKPKKFTYTLD